jgi:hypothetical protein
MKALQLEFRDGHIFKAGQDTGIAVAELRQVLNDDAVSVVHIGPTGYCTFNDYDDYESAIKALRDEIEKLWNKKKHEYDGMFDDVTFKKIEEIDSILASKPFWTLRDMQEWTKVDNEIGYTIFIVNV